MSSLTLENNYEAEVITDKSNDLSTQKYYDRWSKQNDVGVVFKDRGDSLANAAAPITDANKPSLTCTYYGKWSIKYEKDMAASNYNGPKHVVNHFITLGLQPHSRILDVLAGTGLVAQLLQPHGYTNIDAIDGSLDMLAQAKKKQLYKNFYVSLLGSKHVAPVPDDTYDVIIASGSFAPGHLYSDVFQDLIRMAKPGGIITWSMRSDYASSSPRFVNFEADVEKLVTDGVWRHHIPRKDISQYLLGSDGYVYTMQKL